MWFPLSLLALSMLVARRSTEKALTSKISSMAMSWIQQAVALPFIVATLFLARFYWPAELSDHFWLLMSIYVVCAAFDTYCYFKALSLADISFISPLLTITAVGNVLGSYFVLGQKPSAYGLFGASLIVLGAGSFYYFKAKKKADLKTDRLAAILILLIVVVRAYYSNIEVFMVRESNPTTFNFYSSLLTVPLILLASVLVIRTNKTDKFDNYWTKVRSSVSSHRWMLVFIGITYTINMWATYSAKLIAPTAGYVGAIKGAAVLPMTLVGVLFFKEKMGGWQWIGVALILAGLVFLGLN
jgi:drug/metabolite transporter (DMT)-like permease